MSALLRKVLSLMAAALLLLSLAACGTETGDKSDTTAQQSTEVTSTETAETAEESDDSTTLIEAFDED